MFDSVVSGNAVRIVKTTIGGGRIIGGVVNPDEIRKHELSKQVSSEY